MIVLDLVEYFCWFVSGVLALAILGNAITAPFRRASVKHSFLQGRIDAHYNSTVKQMQKRAGVK